MDINNKNELQTHQDMYSRHVQKVNGRTLYSVSTLLCNVKKVYDFGGKYMCISNYHVSFKLIISRTNHIYFTLENIP